MISRSDIKAIYGIGYKSLGGYDFFKIGSEEAFFCLIDYHQFLLESFDYLVEGI
jgi:hypothetical protein